MKLIRHCGRYYLSSDDVYWKKIGEEFYIAGKPIDRLAELTKEDVNYISQLEEEIKKLKKQLGAAKGNYTRLKNKYKALVEAKEDDR